MRHLIFLLTILLGACTALDTYTLIVDGGVPDGGDSDTDVDTDVDTDSDTDTDTDTDTETNQTIVATCAEYLAENPDTVDGPQTLYVGGDVDKPWDAYCHDMGGTPVEYLTLIHVDGDYNFSQYTSGGGMSGTSVRTYYYKLHINPGTFEVTISDDTFSASTGYLEGVYSTATVSSMCYAAAASCVAAWSAAGVGNINLLGTPFKVADNFCLGGGDQVSGSAPTSGGDQVVDLTGGGYCGWLMACPSGTGNVPYNQGCTSALNLLYVAP